MPNDNFLTALSRDKFMIRLFRIAGVLILLVFVLIAGKLVFDVLSGKHIKLFGMECNIPEVLTDTVKAHPALMHTQGKQGNTAKTGIVAIRKPVISSPSVRNAAPIKYQNNGVNNGNMGDTYNGVIQRHVPVKAIAEMEHWLDLMVEARKRVLDTGSLVSILAPANDKEGYTLGEEIREKLKARGKYKNIAISWHMGLAHCPYDAYPDWGPDSSMTIWVSSAENSSEAK